MCGKTYKKVFDQSADILWAKVFLETFIVAAYMVFGGKPEEGNLLICTVISWCILYAVLFANKKSWKQNVRIQGHCRKVSLSVFFAGMGLIVAAQFVGGWLAEGLTILKNSLGIRVYEDSGSIPEISFFSVLIMCVVIPVFEEILFRGIIMKKLGGKIGMRGGVFMSAFLFGLCHLNIEQTLTAFMGGLVFGVVGWTYSVYPAILLHIFNNCYAVLSKVEKVNQSFLEVIFAGIAVLGIFISGIIFMRRKVEGVFQEEGESLKWRECFTSKRFVFLLIFLSALTLGNFLFS